MKIKHWIATGNVTGREVRIYVTTTDELIAADLRLSSSRSLISNGQDFTRRQEVTEESHHHDFAVGAFECYARGRGIKVTNLELTDFIPDGLKTTPIGGDGNSFLVNVYEE